MNSDKVEGYLSVIFRKKLLRNKFFLASVLFIIWVGVIDENNLLERYRNIRQLKQLNDDKEFYIKKIHEDSERLKELKTNNENLEKFAREQYLMKKANEDIFIIIEE
ncbi:MAG: septum formation inhibitor [Bacteroidales bacterium]|nr:septum formation inhibitor [Bacteroidales bacterium]